MLCSSNLARAGGSLFEMAYDVLEELRDEGFQVLEAQVAVLEAQAAAKNWLLRWNFQKACNVKLRLQTTWTDLQLDSLMRCLCCHMMFIFFQHVL